MRRDTSDSDTPADTRTYFAAERTMLLAWVRTGLAMMGFGFVVARFGLFLRELAAEQAVQPRQRQLTGWPHVLVVPQRSEFSCDDGAAESI